jgi:hypothetical protein
MSYFYSNQNKITHNKETQAQVINYIGSTRERIDVTHIVIATDH